MQPTGEVARLWGETCVQEGHLHEALARRDGNEAAVKEALRAYEQAITSFRGAVDPSAEAGAWMNRGNLLQRIVSKAATEEAVRCYDQTIALLALISAEPASTMERGVMLGAAWMNRGGANERLGGEAGRAEARRSLEQAISVLEPWIEAHWAARRNLASAWTNLGRLQLEAGAKAEAVSAQERAATLLAPLADRADLEAERAAILLNLGQARSAAGDRAGAEEAAKTALAGAREGETRDPAIAETALRARHLLCVTTAETLANAAPETRAALIEETDDLVEEGLSLAQAWQERGIGLAGADSRLFAFGSWLHRTWQPERLAPFLLAHLKDGDEERTRIAWAEISWVRQQLVQRSFAGLVNGDTERVVARLAELREVEERLRALAVARNKEA